MMPAMAAVDVQVETVIDRPRHVVAAYAADPDNATAWYVNIKSVHRETPKPLAVGSRFTFSAAFLGRELTYTYQVVDWVPDERLVMRTAHGPFPMETTYTWEDGPNGSTRMTIRNRGKPSGFSRIAMPIMTLAMKRANTNDLARLKSILQAHT
jgi:uncharacterized membrane protein